MDRAERASLVAREYEGLEARICAWAESTAGVRGALVLGSRARTDHPADEWADLDVLVVTSDARSLIDDRSWLTTIGRPRMSFVEGAGGDDAPELRVMFEGGYDVDFACMSPERIRAMAETDPRTTAIALGRGARVLVDKDGVLGAALESLPPDASGPSLPQPDQRAFDQVCSDFWYHCVWTAKHLARGEVWWAKGCCDGYLKQLLRQVLEWEALAEGRDPWFRGRFLEEWADPDALASLGRAFARYDPGEIWQALDATMDIFAEQARRVATLFDLVPGEAAEVHARDLVERIRTTGSFVDQV